MKKHFASACHCGEDRFEMGEPLGRLLPLQHLSPGLWCTGQRRTADPPAHLGHVSTGSTQPPTTFDSPVNGLPHPDRRSPRNGRYCQELWIGDHKVDRLTRSLADSAKIVEVLDAHKVAGSISTTS